MITSRLFPYAIVSKFLFLFDSFLDKLIYKVNVQTGEKKLDENGNVGITLFGDKGVSGKPMISENKELHIFVNVFQCV